MKTRVLKNYTAARLRVVGSTQFYSYLSVEDKSYIGLKMERCWGRSMITAKQAFDLANEANGDTQLFRDLLEKIRKVSSGGDYSLFWYQILTDIQEKKLRDAGYLVDGSPDRGGYFYKISWFRDK